MTASSDTPSTFLFSFAAALDDDSLYVAGVARELEERDVPHTIIWERIAGNWNRYQWSNRTHSMTAYPRDGGATAVYMGYEGTLKVRSSVRGSSEERVQTGNDAPSSLRTLACIRVVGDELFVCGMRRMVYRRPLAAGPWNRLDDGLRLKRADLTVAGLNSIDGFDAGHLFAVGTAGEIWEYAAAAWTRTDAPTNLALLAVRCLPDGRVVAGGENGGLWIGLQGRWTEVVHPYPDESFSCIECWNDRCFVCADSGVVYELALGAQPSIAPLAIEGLPWVGSIATTTDRVWFVGETSVVSLASTGWQDESPPAALLA